MRKVWNLNPARLVFPDFCPMEIKVSMLLKCINYYYDLQFVAPKICPYTENAVSFKVGKPFLNADIH